MANEYPTAIPPVPITLRLQGNGKIKPDQMAPITGGGVMYKTAAVGFNFMYAAASKQGLQLNNWGTYLNYQSQVTRFLSRYSETPTGRNPEIVTYWEGRKWFLNKGAVPCAIPGKSFHGWALSVDVNPAGDRLEWLKRNAPLYGFKWEVGDPTSKYWEPWHLNYCYGSSYTLWVANLIRNLWPKGDEK